MKRFPHMIASLLLLSLLLVLHIPVTANTKKTEDTLNENELYSRSAVLLDADSGRVLFGKDEKNRMPMASTTKIMTCILTLENASLDDIVTVSAYAAKMPEVKLHMYQGEQYKLGDLLYSLMLESHNDSAAAIAEHVGGSIEGFAQMMNEKAQAIGCNDTYFITPNGLDASKDIVQPDGTAVKKVHSTTAVDLARILRYCIKISPKKDEFLKITRTSGVSFHNLSVTKDGSVSQGSRSFSVNNHNAFLHMMDGVLTGKTGFTGNAGYCYTGALENDGRTFIIALLACGWPTNKTWKWKDARKLFQYGIDNYEKRDITNYDYVPNPIPVKNGAGTDHLLKTKIQLPLRVSQKTQVMLLKKTDKVKMSAEVPKLLEAPVTFGKQVGTLNYYVNGNLVSQMPIWADREIKTRTLSWYFRFVLTRYLDPFWGIF